ncbi:FAD-dependent oxidoreductase [Actinoplanes sp. DH11]|uniref:FAD-dependent oxidoreductase n=1 Tax=Actinoplanes sp. DH11 TaxID=2857011 RepID=UPI001E394F63|nr:FAD-dependent oxidoreductase [Actinoplanes sp. DH11]
MKRAIIVGAGIAGLATALRLGRDGWRTTVLERAPGRRSSGYLINLNGPGYDAAERLGLLPALAARALGDFTTTLIRADGRPKFTVPPGLVGDRFLALFRGDLETVLHEAVRESARFRFATTITTIEQTPTGVRVKLSDGTTEEAELLVGADGVHSATRAALFGDGFEVEFPYRVAAFPITGPAESAATTFIGPGRTAAKLNLGPDRSSAFFTWRSEGPEASVRSVFGDLEAFGATIDGMGPDAYLDRVSQVVLPRWSDGRAVLLGDAAWCVTLFAGHGAGLALAGADRLGEALSRHGDDVPAALAAWEAGLRPAVTKRQALARRGMRQYVPPNRFHVWMNDLMIRALTVPAARALIRRGLERQNR